MSVYIYISIYINLKIYEQEYLYNRKLEDAHYFNRSPSGLKRSLYSGTVITCRFLQLVFASTAQWFAGRCL